jgi:methionyl-tRNA formyltransferase
MMATTRAVVFAYHDVGVRCIKVLLSAGVEVPLIVTTKDDPNETQWFASAAALGEEYGIPVVTPDEVNTPQLERMVTELHPDFVFSFYFRSMIGESLLNCARLGALNMHGSYLPYYRGRAPVNWAILHGETQTGATLHYMNARADAGDIVDQLAVPILENDEAKEVFGKVCFAAEVILARSLPGLINGTAPRIPQRLEDGRYFGRRRPEDGKIDWTWSARSIHNLVRAVAPPFPGAFGQVDGKRWMIQKTRVEPRTIEQSERARLFGSDGHCYVACRDGSVLRIIAAATDAGPVDLKAMSQLVRRHPVSLA